MRESTTSIADAGLAEPRGRKRALVPFRKVLLRLLRPSFQRVEAELAAMDGRLESARAQAEQTDRRVRQAVAFGWDYVALVRRVTVLEDLVEELRTELASHRAGDASPRTIPLPGLGSEPSPRRSAEP